MWWIKNLSLNPVMVHTSSISSKIVLSSVTSTSNNRRGVCSKANTEAQAPKKDQPEGWSWKIERMLFAINRSVNDRDARRYKRCYEQPAPSRRKQRAQVAFYALRY